MPEVKKIPINLKLKTARLSVDGKPRHRACRISFLTTAQKQEAQLLLR